jgi:hypothetical protein
VEAWLTGPAEEEGIASEAATSLAVGEGTGMRSEEVPGVPRDTTDRALGPAAAVAPPAWDLGAVDSVVVVAVAGAGRNVND